MRRIGLFFGFVSVLVASSAYADYMSPWVGYGQITESSGGGISTSSDTFMDDDVKFGSGTDEDYWWTYDSANGQYELESATGGLICSVADGGNDVSFEGSISVPAVNGYVDFYGQDPLKNYIKSFSAGDLRIVVGGASVTRYSSSAGQGYQLMYDNGRTQYGTGTDYWHTYNTTGGSGSGGYEFWSTNVDAGVTGADGKVFWIEDGKDNVNFEGGINLAGGSILDSTGTITLGGTGGTNNENITLDFETTANVVALSSTSGAIYLKNNMQLIQNGTLNFGSASDEISWPFKFRFSATATDGQVTLENNGRTAGAVLDVSTAGTLTIKDQAGTGVGNLALDAGGKIYFDADADGDNYISMESADTMAMYVAGFPVIKTAGSTTTSFYAGGVLKWLYGTSGILLQDNYKLLFGTGGDQSLTYTNGTGVTWSDGTTNVITIPDDTNQVNIAGGAKRGHIVVDCDDDPYTVPASADYVTVDTDTGTCTGNMDVTLPAAACTATTQGPCRVIKVKRIGSTQVDIGGDGGTETIDGATTHSLTTSFDAVTLVDTNIAATDWSVY